MLKKLCEFLDSHKIRYITIQHSQAYTAQEVAQSAHIHGSEFAKTVVVRLDGKMAMAVLPAPEKIDLDLLASASGAKEAVLATEDEFQESFPECETGAMPPVGNLFNMDVYLEEEMASNEKITFNAGTHTELVQMSVKDFLSLVKPKITRISTSYSH